MADKLFIADLHLDPQRPEILALFRRFLLTQAPRAEALYILGDLFEYWVGDDQPLAELEECLQPLQALVSHNIPVYLIHGNRDFLLGEVFSLKYGVQLLPDMCVIDLYGTPTLIMHGDTLCTDDVDYQKIRLMFRDRQWQEKFLAQPVEERVQQALQLRQQSKDATLNKQEFIMDVSEQTVIDTMRQQHVRQLIHGHTHRAAVHQFAIDGEPAKRIVLGDWYQQGSVLRCNPAGCVLEKIY